MPIRDDDEDDRPRKKRRIVEEDDEDDRPRKSSKKGGKKKRSPVLLLAVGGGVALLGLVALLVWVIGFGAKVPGVGSVMKSAPTGYTDVRDTDGGYRVFLPGQLHKAPGDWKNANLPPGHERSLYGWRDDKLIVRAESVRPGKDINATTPDELYSLLQTYFNAGSESKQTTLVSKTPIRLGGRPGLEVRQKDNPNWMDTEPAKQERASEPDDWLPPEAKKQWEESQARIKKVDDDMKKRKASQIWHQVYYVTSSGKRLIYIRIETKNAFIDDATLKIITDSFEFL